jgi:hypothetical protein
MTEVESLRERIEHLQRSRNRFRMVIAGLVLMTAAAAMMAQSSTSRTLTDNGPDLHKFITYPQIYPSADGETHFREVTVPLTLVQSAPPAPPLLRSSLSPATTLGWAVFPKGWGLDDLRNRTFHNVSVRRFVSIRKGTVVIIASDGERRRFKQGDVFEALDLAPSKGRIAFTEDGCEVFLMDHP